jgi:hypothetical protein
MLCSSRANVAKLLRYVHVGYLISLEMQLLLIPWNEIFFFLGVNTRPSFQ